MRIRIQNNFVALVPMVLATLNFQPAARAQGTAFTYQGLLQESGSLANGIFNLQFSLYSEGTGGAVVAGPVTNSGIPVSNGLFNVIIDFGPNAWVGATNWLQIGVETNGGSAFAPLTPRQLVTPTPYAITAENLLGGGAGLSGVWQTGGNAGTVAGANFVGTTDGQPLELHVNGQRALRLEPNSDGEPNVIGGAANNSVVSGNVGATIAGGYGHTVNGVDAVCGGGYENTVNGAQATVAGGGNNSTSSQGATVAGGIENQAGGPGAFVGGGGFDGLNFSGNSASGDASVIGGGLGNAGTATYAVVGGGLDNTNNGFAAFIGAGYNNRASGNQAAIPGGFGNVANGQFSFAAGYAAQALYDDDFVWSDGGNGGYASDRAKQFKVQAGGGVQFDVSGSSGLHPAAVTVSSTSANGVGLFVSQNSSDATAVFTASGSGDIIKGFSGGSGGTLAFEVVNNGTVYVNGVALSSDRNAKENFKPVNNQAVLAKVAALPLTEWNYKSQSQAVRHIGPMAQDFQAAFGLDGADDKHISVVDEGGVALAAIQGLNQRLEEQAKDKDARINELEKRLNELEALVKKLGTPE